MPNPAINMAERIRDGSTSSTSSISAKGKGVSAWIARCPSRRTRRAALSRAAGSPKSAKSGPLTTAPPAAERANLVHGHGRHEADETQEQEGEEAERPEQQEPV